MAKLDPAWTEQIETAVRQARGWCATIKVIE
jgi:hypothetical protein